MKRLILISLFILLKCQSTAQVETAKLEIQTEQVKAEFDKAIDCKTQVDSDLCEEVIQKAKKLLDKSVNLAQKKDAENEKIVEKNVSLQEDSNTLLKYRLWIGGIGLLIIMGILCYFFLPQILKFIADIMSRAKPL